MPYKCLFTIGIDPITLHTKNNSSNAMGKKQIGKQVREARIKKGLTQTELAYKCNLDIRTIQRIESCKVIPRFYTIQIINDALNIGNLAPRDDMEKEKLKTFRKLFLKRKKIRKITFFFIMFLMLLVLTTFPSMKLFGIPKQVWGPYFYIIIMIHLIVIAFTWRCPGCNGLLGDVFKIRYCGKCGLQLYDD